VLEGPPVFLLFANCRHEASGNRGRQLLKYDSCCRHSVPYRFVVKQSEVRRGEFIKTRSLKHVLYAC
jgi:hypothetical protein